MNTMNAEKITHLKLTISEQDLQRLLLQHNNCEDDTAMLQDFEIERKHGLIVLTARLQEKGEPTASEVLSREDMRALRGDHE